MTADSRCAIGNGRDFDPLNPDPAEVFLADVALALSNQCRFMGHTPEFYSVAQHSCHVADAVLEETGDFGQALWGLLHDGSEAYLCDLPRPLKQAPGLGEVYRELEANLMAALCQRFGLPQEMPEAVRVADDRMLMTERRDLRMTGGALWPDVEPYEVTLKPWQPRLARANFLGLYHAFDVCRVQAAA